MKLSFEQSLRMAVKRLAKGNFEDAIREVVEHYQDLHGEALSKGASSREAQQIATRRIGVVGDIARKIVDSPARVKSGIRLQWLAALLWVCTPFVSWQIIRLFTSYRNPIIFPDPVIIIVGVLAMIGGFRASKISWKPPAFALSFFLAFTVFSLISSAPRQAKFEAERTKAKQERLADGLQYDRIEAALAPCINSFNDVKSADLERLRTVLLNSTLRTGVGVYTSKNKWIFPYDHRYQPGSIYSLGFGTMNSLDDARMMWRKMGVVNAQWSAMVTDRKSFTEVGYARSTAHSIDNFFFSLPRPAQYGMSISISLLWPFLIGLVLGSAFLRFYVYRLDIFKLRRI
jgi:hypothetical protein